MDLSVSVDRVNLKNPLIVASSDISLDLERFRNLVDSGVGAIVTKSVTDIPQLQSSAITRFKILDRSPGFYTMISRGGPMLPIEKMQKLLPDYLSYAHEHNTRVIGSVCCNTLENWVEYSKEFEDAGVDMLELNLGNPHGEVTNNGEPGITMNQWP